MTQIAFGQENNRIKPANSRSDNFTYLYGGIIRGDSTRKDIALVFTADEFGEGLPVIIKTLTNKNILAGFFFTGRFYRYSNFQPFIKELNRLHHYLGPHSDGHLLYNDWNNRDSLLVTHEKFKGDIQKNLDAMKLQGITVNKPHYFIPPYEWWNDTIAAWSKQSGLQVINFTQGMRTNADYTYPEMGSDYKSSRWILGSLKERQNKNANAFNGAIILIHAGTDPRRKDKLYNDLGELVDYLRSQGYRFKRIDDLLRR